MKPLRRQAVLLLSCSLAILLAGQPASGILAASQVVDLKGLAGDPGTEATPSIRIWNVMQEEGNVGTTDFVFEVTLSETSVDTVTVDFETRNGTAVAGTDYNAATGTVTFLPGETSQPVTVQVIGDTDWENQESFYVDLTNEHNATIYDGTASGTINNDDVRISIGNVSQAEGTGGTTDFVFDVTLSGTYGLTVTVDYATRDGTAKAGTDYNATSGTVTFPPGVTSQPVTVQVIGDTDWENQEYFYVDLSDPNNATIYDGTASGTINNDDVQIFISNVAQAEGNSGTTDFVFDVTLSGTYGLAVEVHYATRDGGAKAGTDYNATSGTVTFLPGETSQPVTVEVIGDTDFENSEYFYVDLSDPNNASIGDPYGYGQIQNDDVQLLISNVTQAEGTGGTTDFVFDVTLSGTYGLTVTVNYATRNGTAVAGTDYNATSGTVTFPPGVTSQPVTVQVIGDTDYESQEYFYVDLSDPNNATVGDPYGVGYINNDDVRILIPDVTQDEGDSGTTDFVFDVTLSGTYGLTVTVDYATRDGTAVAGTDYIATSGTVTFAPGVTSQPVTVHVIGDTVLESQEYFYVDLSDPNNATIGDSYGVGHINNDDVIPAISVGDVALAEGDSGTTDFTFSVTLSAESGSTVSASFATSDGTATAGSDYTAGSGTVTFPPGETIQDVVVAVTGDVIFENDESFYVSLSSPVNGTIGDGLGVGTIQNDEPPVEISIDSLGLSEGDSGATDFGFTVSLSGLSALTTEVDYATTGGTATPGVDYTPGSGTLAFAPLTTSQPLTVPAVGDEDYEIDETFHVDLSSPVNGVIGVTRGTGTIQNDDPRCTPRAGDVTDLAVVITGGGSDLLFNWTDITGAIGYILYEDGVPNGPCSTQAGTAGSGAAGITVSMPVDETYYLLAAENAACGVGARRMCAHGRCAEGERLDSACDLCVADVCAADPNCCDAAWDAGCVEKIRTECGSLACPESQGTCAHTLCTEGAALTAGCDDPPVSPSCVSAICAVDADCCSAGWDADCVSAVAGVCGLNCD